MSASAENKATLEWRGDTNISYTFEDLVIGKDTHWVMSKSGEKMTILSRYGFNPPCFARKDEENNVHVFSREYKIIIGRRPLRLIAKEDFDGKLPRHCTRQQWGLQDEAVSGAVAAGR